MRGVATADRIRTFLGALGRSIRTPATVYLVGGSTAVLEGWRDSTVGIDLKLVPETDELFRAIARLKDELQTNVELASPDLFIPVRPGWQDRSALVGKEGALSIRRFEFVSQALAKLERGHARDLDDVTAMLARGLITREELASAFAAIEGELFRFPAVDPETFRRAVGRVTAGE